MNRVPMYIVGRRPLHNRQQQRYAFSTLQGLFTYRHYMPTSLFFHTSTPTIPRLTPRNTVKESILQQPFAKTCSSTRGETEIAPRHSNPNRHYTAPKHPMLAVIEIPQGNARWEENITRPSSKTKRDRNKKG